MKYDIISGRDLKDMIKQAEKKHRKKFKVLCAVAGDFIGSAEMLIEVEELKNESRNLRKNIY